MTAAGDVVELTLERCQALGLDHKQCSSHDYRDETGVVLCWVHRQTRSRGRSLVLLERVIESALVAAAE